MKRFIKTVALLSLIAVFAVLFNCRYTMAAGFRAQIDIVNSTIPDEDPDSGNTGEMEWVTGSVYDYKSGEEAVLSVDYDLNLFESVSVDGIGLSLGEDYELESGSTIIIFQPRYMNQLSEGEHIVEVAYNDGNAFSTSFTVADEHEDPEPTPEPTPEPDSGDSEYDGEIVVPNTGGGMFGAHGGVLMGISLTSVVVVLLVMVVIKKHNKNARLKTVKQYKSFSLNKNKMTLKVVCLGILVGGICLGGGIIHEMNSRQQANAMLMNVTSSISISTSGDEYEEEVDLTSGKAFVYTAQDVMIDSATKNGYQLFMSTNSDIYNDLSLNGSESAGERILAGRGTIDAPSELDEDEWGYAMNGGAFGNNYSPSEDSLWAGVPIYGSAVLLKSVTGPTSAHDSTRLYYGFNITNNLPDGSYWGTENSTVVYTAVANVVPEYTVSYNCNGGTGEIANQTKEMGDSIVLSDGAACTRDDYNLTSWNTYRDGTGTSYELGSAYSSDADLYLYAIWESEGGGDEPIPEQTFSLQFDANGGQNAPANQSVTTTDNSVTFTISESIPIRDGYTFEGWNLNATGTGTSYAPGGSITVYALDTTLYAQWEQNEPEKVESITISGSQNIDYNGANKTVLSATVLPESAEDKSVTWSSNNTSVAKVSGGGVVTGESAGIATITAQANDGSGVSATYTVYVRQKVIIIIGASQVARFARDNYANIQSYSNANHTYTTRNDTLLFRYESGSGFAYQSGSEGWGWADTQIKKYNESKNYVEFYVYFPMPGNDIKTFACSSISSSNSTIKNYAKAFNNDIKAIKNEGYNVKGIVVSVHPLRPGEKEEGNKYIVSNSNSNRCTEKYRSNYKYYQFNKAMKSIVEGTYATNLGYVPLFIDIMDTSNDDKYTLKPGWTDYKTTDGMHWNNSTAVKYFNAMLNKNSSL